MATAHKRQRFWEISHFLRSIIFKIKNCIFRLRISFFSPFRQSLINKGENNKVSVFKQTKIYIDMLFVIPKRR